MGKVYSKRLTEFSDADSRLWQGSQLLQQVDVAYPHSVWEQRFGRAYCEARVVELRDTVVFHDQEPILFLQYQVHDGVASMWDHPIKLHALHGAPGSVLDEAYKLTIRQLASDGVREARFFHDPHWLNLLWDKRVGSHCDHRGFLDLEPSEELVYAQVRKSYKSLINWGRKNLQLQLFDKNNITVEEIDAFRGFHIEVAGRETRGRASWLEQMECIRAGRGYMLFALLEGKLVSAIMILHGTQEACYGVAVNRRDLMEQELPIGHWPLYHCILRAKQIGMRRFNIGLLAMSSGENKVANIARFKKGFCDSIEAEVIDHFRWEGT